MNPNDRADLVFDLADVLNGYVDECGYDPGDVRAEAIGYVKGWRDH